MPIETKKTKKIYNRLYMIAIIILWVFLFSWIFYKGSSNVDMWGKWQGLEIIIPILISFIISSIIILPIYFIRQFLKNKKRK